MAPLTLESMHSPATLYLTFGTQHVTQQPDAQKNFLVVDNKTDDSSIAQAFDNFTQKRKDIAILLINQHVSTMA